MKKYLPILIIAILVLCGLQATSQPMKIINNTTQLNQQPSPPLFVNEGDILDQSQTEMDFFNPVGTSILWLNEHFIVAQSFIPTKNRLTRVELLLTREESSTHPYTISIRDSLFGTDLTTVSVPANQISTEMFSWVEFDFSDINVIPGQPYYIISSTLDTTENWYSWGLKIGQNVYPSGTVYVSTDYQASWQENSFADMSFKTYGMDVTELQMSLTGGVGVTVNVENIGFYNADQIETTITISGGMLEMIDMFVTEETLLLSPNDTIVVSANPLGFGPVSITATTQASNAEPITKTVQAFCLLFFVFLQSV